MTPVPEVLVENPGPLTVGSHTLEWCGVHYLNGLIYMENLPSLPFAVLLFITEVSDPIYASKGHWWLMVYLKHSWSSHTFGVLRCAPLCSAQKLLNVERPKILDSCFTVHKMGQTVVFMVMFTFTVRKNLPATQHIVMLMCEQPCSSACCPQAATGACYSSQAAELCSHPSDQWDSTP